MYGYAYAYAYGSAVPDPGSWTLLIHHLKETCTRCSWILLLHEAFISYHDVTTCLKGMCCYYHTSCNDTSTLLCLLFNENFYAGEILRLESRTQQGTRPLQPASGVSSPGGVCRGPPTPFRGPPPAAIPADRPGSPALLWPTPTPPGYRRSFWRGGRPGAV